MGLQGKARLTNQINFDNNVTHVVDQGKPVNVNFLEFSKALDAVSYSILLDKTSSVQLDKYTLQRLNN